MPSPPIPFPAAASAQSGMSQPPVVPSFTAPDDSLPGASNMVFRREKDNDNTSGEEAQEYDIFENTSELRPVTAEQRARTIARMASQSSLFSNQPTNASQNMRSVNTAGNATEANFAHQRALSIASMSNQSSQFINQSSQFSNQLTNASHNMLPVSNAGNAIGETKADGNQEFDSLHSVTADQSYEYKAGAGETPRRYNVEISENITSKDEGLLHMDHVLPNFPVTPHGPGYVLGNHPSMESGSVSQTFNILKTGEAESAATGAQYLQDGMDSKEKFKANLVGNIETENMAAKHLTQEHSHQSHPSSSANVLSSIGRSGDARQNADNHSLEARNRDNVLEEIKVPIKRKISGQQSIAEYHNMQKQVKVTAASSPRHHNRAATTLRSAVTDGISLAHAISKVAITSTSPDLTVSDHLTNKSGAVPEQNEIPSTCKPIAIATVAEDQYDDMVMSGDEVPNDEACGKMIQKAVEDEGTASNTAARDLIAKFSKRLGEGVEKKKEVAKSSPSLGANNGGLKKSPAQTRDDMEAEHLFRLHFTSLVACLKTTPDAKKWGIRQPSELKLCVPMGTGPHPGHVYWEHILLSLQTVAWDYGFRACVFRRVGGATHHECSWARKVPVTLVPAPADEAGLRAFYLEEIRRLIDMIHPHVDCHLDGTVWIVVEGRKPQRFPYDPRFAYMSKNLEKVLDWFPRGLTGLRQ
jgi:hypothetical protein